MKKTSIILKDGRLGYVNESISTIKHCKRNKLTMLVFMEGDLKKQSLELPARSIASILFSDTV